ncbi:hypothetical protein BWQ96_10568 [Gracilariopsis chorda]|uniref:Uncharacterized protein n=1 Tax=Gracilariopsis chorda TaxID=448386 RepID=A0A2V3IEV9_9FLOR|nr:hypothetical protein BWQ96_10568 [Gracilariopsis chorda]|eukprot:PXF39730.1 hypothetical protein BWQ96_10568 [Gracilariopsis chorda]
MEHIEVQREELYVPEYEQHNYVAVLRSSGKSLVLEKSSPSEFNLPEVHSDCTPITAVQFLVELRDSLEIDGELHIVEHQRFYSGGNDSYIIASLVIVEDISDSMIMSGNLQSIEWKQCPQVLEQVCKHSAVSDFLQSFLHDPSPYLRGKQHLPWYEIGFYPKMLPKMQSILQEKGIEITDSPEQFQFSYRAAIYRIPTSRGRVFVKFVSWTNKEIAKMSGILNIVPHTTDFVFHSSLELNSFFSFDFGLSMNDLCFVLRCKKAVAGYEDQHAIASEVLTQWASIQQNCVSRIAELTAAKIPIYDETWIRYGLEQLETYVGQDGVSSVFQSRLRSCHDHVDRTLALWEKIHIFLTIVHGDLNETNIAQPHGRGSSYLFFDWETAFVGHPFLDLLDVEYHPLYRSENAYLESWSRYTKLDFDEVLEVAKWTKPMQFLVAAIAEMLDGIVPIESRKRLVHISVEQFVECVETFEEQVLQRQTG